MPERIFKPYYRILSCFVEIVIIYEFFTRIIGRVDVDHVDFAGVGVGKGGEGLEIVALDYDMIW